MTKGEKAVYHFSLRGAPNQTVEIEVLEETDEAFTVAERRDGNETVGQISKI